MSTIGRSGRFVACGMLLTLLVLSTFVSCERSEKGAESTDMQWTIQAASYPVGTLQIIDGFNSPYGLEVESDGELYVPDLREGRVIRFTPDFRFDGWLGMVDGDSGSASGWHYTGSPARGLSVGMFDMAHSVDFDQQGRIYVADYANGRVHMYAPDGQFLGLFFDPPSSPELAFVGVSCASFDADYNLWVADFDAHRVFKFAPDGSLIGWLGADSLGNVSLGFKTSGTSEHTSELGGFNKPHMVRVDDEGNIYVVETGNHRIQKMTADGTPLGWIGARTDGTVTNGWETTGISALSDQPGGFINPVSLRFMQGDTLLIADNTNHRIQKFTFDGVFAGWLGGTADGGVTPGWVTEGISAQGSDPGQFAAPFDAQYLNGKIYVADGWNGRVQVFELNASEGSPKEPNPSPHH